MVVEIFASDMDIECLAQAGSRRAAGGSRRPIQAPEGGGAQAGL